MYDIIDIYDVRDIIISTCGISSGDICRVPGEDISYIYICVVGIFNGKRRVITYAN